MNGYTYVSDVDIKEACTNWKIGNDQGNILQYKGIQLYYDKYVTNGGWWSKLFPSKQTPYGWVYDKVPMFGSWADILCEVLTPEETVTLRKWCYRHHKEAYDSLNALLLSSKDGNILLGDSLCKFVNKYKELS